MLDRSVISRVSITFVDRSPRSRDPSSATRVRVGSAGQLPKRRHRLRSSNCFNPKTTPTRRHSTSPTRTTGPLPRSICSNRVCRVTSKQRRVHLGRIARRLNDSRLSRKAEECHHRSFDLDDLLRCQPANPDVDIRPFDGCELVDHHVTVVIKSGQPAVSAGNPDAHQRCIQQRAGHGSNSY